MQNKDVHVGDGSPPTPRHLSPVVLDQALLGQPRVLTAGALAEEAKVSQEFLYDYWRALGLPIAEDHKTAFTHADAAAVSEIAELATREGYSDDTVTTLVRSVGHTTDRLALWQVESLVDHAVSSRGMTDAEARREVLDQLPALLPILESQLLHAWRRQIAALAGRYAIEFASHDEPAGAVGELPLPRAVGFADIVSFTRRTAGLGPRDLAEFVQGFESKARDLITAFGGRVVKTIGDAVLFIADDVATGAQVALGLAEQGAAGETGPIGHAAPPVRVSLVWGRVLSRFGDVFGPTVNLASRLCEESDPGQVLVDQATALALADDARFVFTLQDSRELQGVGDVAPLELTRA